MSPYVEWYEPLLLPFIFSFAAATVWFLGWNAETQGKRAPWKWSALILVALGLVFGWRPFVDIQDAFYARQFIGERKKHLAHHAAFYMPLAVGAAIGVWAAISRRAGRKITVDSND